MNGWKRALGAVLLSAAVALPGASGFAQSRSTDELEARLGRVERMLESGSLADMFMQLQQLQREVRQLRGDLEFQAHAIEELKRRQLELIREVKRPGGQQPGDEAEAETPQPSAPVTEDIIPKPAELALPAPAAPSGAEADPSVEQVAYQNGFNLLRDGRYADAINVFRAFLASYPESSYAGAAQYWLAESHYVSRNFKEAVEEFRKVIAGYPGSSKDADARLKMGYAYYELGEWELARQTLSELIARYPDAKVARLAQSRLERMRLEGH
ncbi:MAG: tol-pal system protein YbgF [Gammaproteobacteria bacterium]